MSKEKQMADVGTHHCVSEFVSSYVRAPTAESDHCDIEPFGAIGEVSSLGDVKDFHDSSSVWYAWRSRRERLHYLTVIDLIASNASVS